MRIAVIGGGWYGCHIAAELLRHGEEVILYEQSDTLFSGSSGFNQFRLHLGFHYPRSAKTRQQVQSSYKRFVVKYPHLIYPVTTNVYGISRKDSVIDFETYKTVMEHDCAGQFQEIEFEAVGLTNLDGAIVCQEGALLANEPKRFFSELLRSHVQYNTKICNVSTMYGEDGQECGVEVDGEVYDWCIDCTYGQLRGFSSERIVYEVCLTLLYKRKVRNNANYSHAFTIMDGPFTSLFPYFRDYADARGDLNRLHTLTHVQHTHLAQFVNFQAAQQFAASFSSSDALRVKPNFESAISHYLPTFSTDYTYDSYFISFKTKTIGRTDGRETLCERDGRTITVMSGKINTIFQAQDFVFDALEIPNDFSLN